MTKGKPDKHAGGRPTKYRGPATVAQVDAVWQLLRDRPTEFMSYCGLEQLADALRVCKDTLYEWRDRHEEFSEALKRWTVARNAAFYKTATALPPALWIFLAKNWLGMRDRHDVAGGLDLTTSLRFEFGSNGATDDKGEDQ